MKYLQLGSNDRHKQMVIDKIDEIVDWINAHQKEHQLIGSVVRRHMPIGSQLNK